MILVRNSFNTRSKCLLALTLILNLFFGFGYSILLIGPATSNFDSNKIISITAASLAIYNIGKLLAGLLDNKFSQFYQGYSLTISVLMNILALFLHKNISYISPLFLGYSSVLGSISLREILTEYESIPLKKMFNSFSVVGWSIGVATSSYFNKFSNLILATLIILVLTELFITIKLSKKKHSESNSINLKNIEVFSNFRQIIKIENMQVLFFGVLIYNLVISLINTNISTYLKSFYDIPNQYLSLFLGLPIVGAIISGFLTSFNINTMKPLRKYILFKIFTILFAITIFSSLNFYLAAILLMLLGYTTNEETAYSYQLIYENSENANKRTIHAAVDVISVIGSICAWILSKTNINIIHNLFYSLVTFIVTTFFLIKFTNSNMKEDS